MTGQRYVTGKGICYPFEPKALKKTRTAKKAHKPASLPDQRQSHPSTLAGPDEIWQPFPGFEDRYELSSHGRVCSVHSGLIIPQEIDENGFYCLWIKRPHTRKKLHLCIHLAVATSFLPAPQGLPIVRHKDGNQLNNHFSNLEYVPTPTTDSINQTNSTPSTPPNHD